MAEVAVRSLLREGCDVHVIAGYGKGARLKGLLGDNCHLIDADSWKSPLSWWRLRQLLKTLSADIIHYVDGVNWMVASSICLPGKRVLHQHYRPSIVPFDTKSLALMKFKMLGVKSIISISYGAASDLKSVAGIDPQKIKVIHNAVDIAYLPSALKHSEDQFTRLGMAVRIVKDKGVEEAIELLCLLPRRFKLVVAGDGPDIKRLKLLVKEKGLQSRVEWLGLLSDVRNFYSAIDYYLFMSWYEGFGLSVAEAMACGIPVVGLLGDGEISEPEYPLVTDANSMLIPKSSIDFKKESDPGVLNLLSDELIKLDLDGPRRAILIQNGRNWIQDRFSSERYGLCLVNHYRDIIG